MTEKNGVYSGVIGGHFAGDTPNRWEVDGNVLTLSGQYFYGWNETGCLDAWSDSYIPWYQFCDQIDTIRFKDFNISCMNTDMGAYVVQWSGSSQGDLCGRVLSLQCRGTGWWSDIGNC